MQLTIHNNIAIRYGSKDDHSFVLNSWLNSYLDGRPDAKHLRNDVYYPSQTKVIEKLLASEVLLVATPKDEPGVILSWIVFSEHVIWYAYTKGPFRRAGLQRALAEHAGIDTFSFNATTPLGRAATRGLDHDVAIYNPYLVIV